MNLAIIIGISEYKDSKNNLPGCKNDTDIVNCLVLK
ncbi:MAG: caspase family protein [Bacteroidia bacterium]|nr:caspase family protein [Bacteroidia bacterium]